MSLPAEQPLQRLRDIAKDELATNPTRSLDHLHFDRLPQARPDLEFTNVRTDMYLSPAAVPCSVRQGLARADEASLRVFGAAAIRKVGVMLEVPNDAIVIAQSIFQRFYFQYPPLTPESPSSPST